MKIKVKELRYLVRNVLSEKRRFHIEDRWQENYEKLKSYVDKGYFFHMTDDYLLHGLNPHTEHETPFGIYTYPLTSEMFKLLMENKLPYATEREYVILYKPIGNFVKVSQYSEEDFLKDAAKLGIHKKSNIEKIKTFSNKQLPASWLMCAMYMGNFDLKNAIIVNKKLRKLGYVGIYDDIGAGVIHDNEPTQAVFVGPDVLNIVDVLKNVKFKLQSGKDVKHKLNKMSIEQLKYFFSIWANLKYLDYIDTSQLPEEIQTIIVKTDPHAINKLSNPTEKVQNLAKEVAYDNLKKMYKRSPWEIRYNKNPSLEFQLIAVKSDPEVIKVIKHPAQEVIDYINSLQK